MSENGKLLGIGRIGDRLANTRYMLRYPRLANSLPSTEFDWGPDGPPPDRSYLEDVLLPQLAQEGPCMLSVGVANYTKCYRRIVGKARPGIQYVTTDAGVDLDEKGIPILRLNVTDPNFPDQIRSSLRKKRKEFPHFDSIVLNGIIGWGINSIDEIKQAMNYPAAS